MSQDQETKASVKPLSILLFFLIIAGLAFAAVQLVELAPSGFNRVAALAERVNNSQQTILDFSDDNTPTEIALSKNTSYTASGETIVLSWPEQSETGTYYFSYECTEGIGVTLRLDGSMTDIDCDTVYNLGNATAATMLVASEADRYADLTYSITFAAENDTKVVAAGTERITIVNDEVTTLFADATVTNEPETASSVVTPEPTISAEAASTDTLATDEPTSPSPQVAGASAETPDVTPIAAPTPVIPVSDENGSTDLATRFVAIGNIIGDTFFVQDIIKDHRGAVQFEVKNLGTKTSEDWTYTLTLPSGGTYESDTQVPLKPNERALITIGFPTPAITDYQFTVSVDTTGDQPTINDQFTRSVALVN